MGLSKPFLIAPVVAHKKYRIEDKEYLLRVVYEEGEKIEVVTVYLTSQIERYWKEDKNED